MNKKNLFITIILMCILGACSTNAQEERLSGEFSVSATRKVRFTLGNLQYHVGSQTWDFAKNQSDVVGEQNVNFDNKNYNGNIDLFSLEDLETVNSIYKGKWRILSDKEWNYLLHERKNAEELWGYGIVNSQKGLILLPDDWSFSDDDNFPFTSGEPYYMGWEGYDYKNTFSLNEFMKYEKKGVVFLPSAGCVKIGLGEYPVYTYKPGYGNGGRSGYYLYLNESDIYEKYGAIEIRVKGFTDSYAYAGRCSIRLVQDVE